MRKEGGGKGPAEILINEVGAMTMPLYMVLQGEVSVYKPAPIIVDEKSSPSKKLTTESTKQSMPSYELPSRNIIMSHQTLKTKTTVTKGEPTVIPEDLNDDASEKNHGLLLA